MFKLPVKRSFPLGSDQRERSATCCRAKLGAVQIPCGARAAVSTIEHGDPVLSDVTEAIVKCRPAE